MTGTGPQGPGRYGERVFRPEAGGEGDRIDLGSLTYDATTMSRLRRLGVGPGWTCLDLGAGTGTVARRLLEEAGVAEVVAVDRDVRFLTAHPVPGLTPLQADITTDGLTTDGLIPNPSPDLSPDLSPGRFRLVHARFLLMHLPDRPRLVARFVELLAPGGVLVISDAVDLTTDSAPLTPYTAAMRAMWRGLRDSIGTDVSQVVRHPELLEAAGLESVAAEIHVPPLLPGSPISRFWADTWDRARSDMLATGLLDEGGLDEALRLLESPGYAGLSPGMLTAWGWKPGAPGAP
ncbi:class I SAM-dependent methyltransferase [Streptomyces sp. NPDC056401]|uniref:class I SAM-dependent methyltransferase n=1 Tax=Streptomyces sp. NPDC056401 TaxID=3345809 RepID=UPI0035DFF698